jgi:hypothetical protein
VLAAACGGGSNATPNEAPTPTAGSGASRTFLMGVSSQPSRTNEKAYRDAFDVAGQAGEVVLIQRTPPWSEFVPGGSISHKTEQVTLLANLPDNLKGEGFTNPDIRAAFIAYAKYLALNYKPAYLALGVEVDMIYRGRGDGSFRNFLSLYFEAYDAVKSVSPDTLVFPTFQYEDMLGLLNTGSPTLPTWTLVKRFEPKIDMLAVTSYPSLVFDRVSALPLDYYDALKGVIDKPIAFASIGWNSADVASGAPDDGSQPAYLYRALSAAENLDGRLLIWYLGRDPETVPQGFEPLANMGLQDSGGHPKSIWRIWTSALTRPMSALAP